ncbi:hypothetical protein D9V41_02415 [Aeromicrobium phragmitis]|uniref:DUF485 domain-containing protein n=1 Tax=Aeromicrobium phragmitis TaxID=2478914 RepID=A0A3L8PQ66_9ACTN|nr:hypothetical protein [Aeromicrobium phragmitis]RLV57501.1 hypothetical protein D9V41_02415 [Aeromicrobium phragmitis]
MTEQRRERITNPLTTARTHVPRSVRQEIDESTGVGQVYIRSLVRSQLRAALTVLATLAFTVGALPLVFLVLPAVKEAAVLGIPLPWIVLGIAVYPAVLLLGWLYVRYAERAESDFIALVESENDEAESP